MEEEKFKDLKDLLVSFRLHLQKTVGTMLLSGGQGSRWRNVQTSTFG
jgi:hypothetical protein